SSDLAADDGANGRAASLDDRRPTIDRFAAYVAIYELVRPRRRRVVVMGGVYDLVGAVQGTDAGEYRAKLGAAAADDFGSARVDRGRIGKSAGEHDHRTAGEERVRGDAARPYDRQAGEERVAGR